MGLPTHCLAPALALCVFLPSATPTSWGLAAPLDLLTSLDRIDQALPLQDRKKRKWSGSGSSSSGSSSSGSSSSGSSESGSAEGFTDALAEILDAAAAGSDLLPVFAALALGSVPNPVTAPLDFTTSPLVTALTSAATSAEASLAARDLAAALLNQFFGQARLAQDPVVLSKWFLDTN